MLYIIKIYNDILKKLIANMFLWAVLFIFASCINIISAYDAHDFEFVEQPILFFPIKFNSHGSYHILTLFLILWFWFFAMIVAFGFSRNNRQGYTFITFLETLNAAKDTGKHAYNRFQRLVLKIYGYISLTTKCCLILTYLFVFIFLIFMDRVLSCADIWIYRDTDCIVFFVFIPVIVMLVSLFDCYIFNSIRFGFQTNFLKLYVYTYFHSVIGCSILSLVMIILLSVVRPIHASDFLLLPAWLFCFFMIPTLSVNMSVWFLSWVWDSLFHRRHFQ